MTARTRGSVRADLQCLVDAEAAAAAACCAVLDDFACPAGWLAEHPEVQLRMAQIRMYNTSQAMLRAVAAWTLARAKALEAQVFGARTRGDHSLPAEFRSLETTMMRILTDAGLSVHAVSQRVFALIDAERLVPTGRYSADSIRKRWRG